MSLFFFVDFMESEILSEKGKALFCCKHSMCATGRGFDVFFSPLKALWRKSNKQWKWLLHFLSDTVEAATAVKHNSAGTSDINTKASSLQAHCFSMSNPLPIFYPIKEQYTKWVSIMIKLITTNKTPLYLSESSSWPKCWRTFSCILTEQRAISPICI